MASFSRSYLFNVIPSRENGEGPRNRAKHYANKPVRPITNCEVPRSARNDRLFSQLLNLWASPNRKLQMAHTARERTTRPVRAFAEGTAGANRKENSKSKMLPVCA